MQISSFSSLRNGHSLVRCLATSVKVVRVEISYVHCIHSNWYLLW